MSLITIKTSHFETELIILRGRLESEGINCFLKNEFTTQIMNHMATFEVELQVSDLDVEKAKKILSAIENSSI